MRRVLIIDNNAADVQALMRELHGRGVESQSTADGNEALQLITAFAPQVIVLCVELPRLSGYSICNKLKKDLTLAAIPLILTSSQATEETFEQHKKLKTRAEAYLIKPYDLAQMLGLIGQYITMETELEEEVVLDTVAIQFDDVPVTIDSDADNKSEEESETWEETPVVPPQPVARVATSNVADSVAEQMRAEVSRLRQKVQKLEQQLQDKDLEFNDRLLQESARSREAVELKKKLSVVERDIGKSQQQAEKSRQEIAAVVQELQEAREEQRRADEERHEMVLQLDNMRGQLQGMAAERDGLRSELDSVLAERTQAREAIDAAVRALDETL